MKTRFLIIIAIFAISQTYAQKSVEQFFEQFAAIENVNKLTLQGSLLQLAGNYTDDKKESRTIAKLNKLSAMWIEDFNPISKKSVNSLLRNLRKDQFESLIVAREGASNVNFLVRENGRHITGVILLVDSADSFLLINLTGKLKFEDLGSIDLDIEGMEHFKKIPKNRSELKRA